MWQSTADYRHVVALRQWDGAKIWELLGDLMDEDDHALIFEDVEIQNAADVEHVCYLTATRGVVVDLVALELYANFQRARTAAPYVTIDCGSGAKAPAAPGPIRLAYDHFLVADDGLLSSLRRFHRYNMGYGLCCGEVIVYGLS
ncbi:hypothetical protein SARC_12070 [Sphaeroforma arctica JP610]|uniref:Uncharacterized protein n=1 Tax=Sphaeroforma arctica JP610 TaxID=667725 RepID=A0A0L0FF48_9EUKA|nr:hypothetical protein SARC_12070 [Sphaeroforma arctica JP610]KNC75404.1 hypothetical protein SARC_12070 [Sphaeroforma arctica JP610]|eukprot:XP_014149306.1 hypothetical protein SARC_12070 [Sphaeroforma arctica JP610]